MSTIVAIEYIGPRRDPNYAQKVGCAEGTRELVLKAPILKYERVKGKNRDLDDDKQMIEHNEVRVPVPRGKTVKRNGIVYNFIPETDYICEVSDPNSIGYLLSMTSLFRMVSKREEEPKVEVRYVERVVSRKKTVKKKTKKPKFEETEITDDE